MNEPESNRQLAVFDSLLEELARVANEPKTKPADFFQQVEQLVDAIISPSAQAVVSRGPNSALLLIHGEAKLANEVSKVPSSASDTRDRIELKPKSVGTAVTGIEVNGAGWGWLLTQITGKVSPVHTQILDGVSEIVSEFLQTQQAKNHAEELRRNQQYSNQVHSSLDLCGTANNIANEARLLLNCERVSVYSTVRGRERLLAVSSVASVEKRSELMKRQRQLVRQATRFEEPIGSDKPPEKASLHRAMNVYQKKSGFPFLFGIHLRGTGDRTGYLLAESTEEINRLEFAKGLTSVLPPASLALENALQHDSIPFRGALGTVGNASRWMGISKSAVALGFLVLGIAALCFLQTDFKIRIRGELRPAVERVVFAPADGLVASVDFKQNDEVQANERLLQLRSPKLELALAKTKSEFDKLSQLLDSKNLALNQASSDPNTASSIIGQLTSEISDINYQLESLADEQKYVGEQLAKLTVQSPIDGVVLTRNLDSVLAERPVRWGDPLLSIADEKGDWILKFAVPERKMGYLLSAWEQSPGAEVQFFFEANPDERFVATVTEIANSTTEDAALGPVAIVECLIPKSDFVKRHGATVLADVDCGRKSIGFVWTRELIDSIKRKYVW